MKIPRSFAGLVALCLVCASCATPVPPPADLQPGEKPSDETAEAGLWMQMDRAEQSLKTSGQVVDDPALNAYVREILCKLAGDFCKDVRVYIVESAGFNALMAPNGLMIVWTGMILRAQNEAQLAFVLGHELTHYVKRHSIHWWQERRARADSAAFLDVAFGLGVFARMASFGGLMEFSRDQEREADRAGLEIMARAGYDPKEAPKIWAHLIAERGASDDEEPSIFFSTHPQSEERQETLTRLAEAWSGSNVETGRARFLAETGKWRSAWLRAELRERDLAPFHVVLDHVGGDGTNQGVVSFYRGEAHRLEGGDAGREMALASYAEALKFRDAPPEAHRSMGLIYWSMKREAEAHAAFRDYLAAMPGASDRQMIEYYLERAP